MFEDIHLKNNRVLEKALSVMNFSFAIIFTVEMLLKILGMGFVGYFTNLWNCLDSFIVAVSCYRLHNTLSGDYLTRAISCFYFVYPGFLLLSPSVSRFLSWWLPMGSVLLVFASMRFQPVRTAPEWYVGGETAVFTGLRLIFLTVIN